jgi:hypothetical protein
LRYPCQWEGSDARDERANGNLFSYVDLEERVPAKHPLRLIQLIVNDSSTVTTACP